MTSGLRLSIAIVVLLLAAFVPGLGLAAGKRVALVIGNSAYQRANALPNPARDAAAIEATLKMAGFSVTRATDVGASAMRRALRDFSDQVRDADIAAVFYAGHGIEVNGANYLVPVDAVMERDIDVEDEAVPLDRISQILEPAKRLRLIMLDACRDNPFLRTMKRTMATRSIGRGLAKVEVLSTDTLVAYAARAGSTAEDGDGSNSPYTTALIKHLTTPGLDLRLAFGRVRDEVLKTTGNRQEPFVYGSLGGSEVALVEKEGEAASPAPAATGTPAANSPSFEAERAWAAAKETTSLAVLEAFVARFKDTFYADLAKAKIEELKRAQEAKLAPPPSNPVPGPAPMQPASAAPYAVLRCKQLQQADCAGSDLCMWDNEGKKTGSCKPKHAASDASEPAASAGSVAVPKQTFYKAQTSSQTVYSEGELVGADILDLNGRRLGTVLYMIKEGSLGVGFVFKHYGKAVGLRISSVLTSVDYNQRIVTLKIANADQVLAALPEYEIKAVTSSADAAVCKGMAENVCKSGSACEWVVAMGNQAGFCKAKSAGSRPNYGCAAASSTECLGIPGCTWRPPYGSQPGTCVMK